MTSSQTMQTFRQLARPDPQHDFAVKLMELLVIPTFVLDINCKVIIWNRACERLTGVPAHEVLGTSDHWRSFYTQARPTLADLLMLGRGAELRMLCDQQVKPGDSGNNLCAENWCEMPRAGRRRYLAIDASPIYDQDGKIIAAVETLRDMTEEKRTQIALEQLAARDGLTGLANRRCFDSTMNTEWQQAMRQHQELSLLMVDVDNFKEYNDAYGHLAGDECLQRIANAVSHEMRANDLVARYGGEEFAVILPNQSLKGAAIVAERIRSRVEQLHLPRQKNAGQFVTVSIGVASALPLSSSKPGQLLAVADAALYRAKNMGRNRISLLDSDIL